MTKKPAKHPRGYRTCTASLAVANVATALSFYSHVFGAETKASDTVEDPHFASIKIGNSMLFVTAGWEATRHVPAEIGASVSVSQHMYVDDVDAVFAAAVEAGASVIATSADTYWGERCATIADPFGHVWTIATRLENLNASEIEERRDAFLGKDVQEQESA